MTQPREKTVGFKSIKLFKDQTLGIGSYGKVCKARCDDLLCAAKLIHETLIFDPTTWQDTAPQREHRLPMRRFEQECEFLSTIRHPNIIQYLGIYQDPDTGLPALLMELMDDSLTHFLDSSSQPIPYHIQVDICHDISLALSFLHSNDIVHRDLSSNNILLRGKLLAKVTDFGMARLCDRNPRATHLTFTMCPGTDVYMPPETVQDKPEYTEKINCFSFGVITLQILTRTFPKPGDRRKRIDINYPGFRNGAVVEMLIAETDRRHNHICEVDPGHTLLQVSLDCLKDRDVERPSSHQLCDRIGALKEHSEYSESVSTAQERSTQEQGVRDGELRSLMQQHAQEVQDLQQIIQSQASHLEEKDRTIVQNDQTILQKDQALRQRDETIAVGEQQARQQQNKIDQLEREKIQAKEERKRLERQLELANHQLEESKQIIVQMQEKIADLEQVKRASVMTPGSKQPSSSLQTGIQMSWRMGETAPCHMSSSCPAVADDTALYVRNIKEMYAYTISTSTWCRLPHSPTHSCPSVIVNNLLTVVGGYIRGAPLDKLFSLTGKGSGRKWTEVFPPMPTERAGAAALCTREVLVVAGGMGEKSQLQTVEVMNTETLQWSTAACLPDPLSRPPAAVCGDRVYILSLGGDQKVMYTCSVSALVQSSESSPTARVWSEAAAPPLDSTTCVSVRGQLLTLGGKDTEGKTTSAVYVYDQYTDSWAVVSHMAMPRYCCFAALVTDNQLMVVGGLTDVGETDSVELATINIHV